MKQRLSHNGVHVGEIEGSVFYRKVDPALNLVRQFKGYAMHPSLLDVLLDRGIETIVLIEPKARLTSDIADWQTLGHDYYGYKVLSVSHMVKG